MRLVATCWSSDADLLERQVAEAAAHLREAKPRHLVEARLDLLSRPPSRSFVARLAALAPSSLLVTCRPDGAGSPATRAAREALLRGALEDGAAAVDLDHVPGDAAPLPELPPEAEVVLSFHAPPGRVLGADDMAGLAREMAARGPDVVKIASPAGSASDALDLAVAGRRALPPGTGWAPIALGPGGTWLRLLAGRELPATRRPASDFAYVAGGPPLPGLGQPRLADALAAGIADVDASWPVFGVLGWPLAETWSPALHARLWRLRDVRAACVALPARDAAECRRLLDELDLAGAAVTMPHKAAAATELASGGGLAEANTLRRRRPPAGDAARFEAASFDGPAALAALGGPGGVAGRRVVVVGSGGAARCAVVELLRAGSVVTILARRPESVPGSLGGRVLVRRIDEARDVVADVLVNATPVGSLAVPGLPVPALLGASLVLDMVTTPPETELIRLARREGIVAVDGLVMLAYQAAAQQRWWSGLAGEEATCLAAADVLHVLREITAESSPHGLIAPSRGAAVDA